MAEIPLERKKKSNLLPLLLGLIALLLLLGFCFMRRDRGTDPATAAGDSARAFGDTTAGAGAAGAAGAATGAAAGAGGAGGAVDEFTRFVAARDTSAETEANHQYTATGVRLLAGALEELAGDRQAIRVYADSMRSSVDRLQRTSDNDVHADDARAAFNAAVSAMEVVDRARGRTRDVAPMRGIARELSSQRPLVPQLGTVQRFFEAARDALQQMRAS